MSDMLLLSDFNQNLPNSNIYENQLWISDCYKRTEKTDIYDESISCTFTAFLGNAWKMDRNMNYRLILHSNTGRTKAVYKQMTHPNQSLPILSVRVRHSDIYVL
jgi:hypothetical protein